MAKILMIATTNNNGILGGVGYYRITSPAKKLKEYGFDIDVVNGEDISTRFRKDKSVDEVIDVYSNILSTYDLVWMKHTDNEAAIAALFSLKKQFNCKVVWDFDDDLFNVRESQPAWEQYKPQSRKRSVVAAAISMCDAITVSTEPLKESIAELMKTVFNIDKDIYVCPNFIDPEEWGKVKYRPSNSPVIGYYGSTTHWDDLKLVIPTIYKLLAKHKTASFQIMGALTSDETINLFKDCPDPEIFKRLKLVAGLRGWQGFPDLLLRTNWDIAIAPLIDDKFNQAKSNIKWLETAMKGIPCVCSDVAPYSDSVKKNTGFLCNEKDWYNTLNKLIKEPEYRSFIGKTAKAYVLKEWTDKPVKKWVKTLNTLLA